MARAAALAATLAAALALAHAAKPPAPTPTSEVLRDGHVLVQAWGLREHGRPLLANEALAVPRGGFVNAFELMQKLADLGALNFSYVRLPKESGREGLPVVRGINGFETVVPITAWIASAHRPVPGAADSIIEHVNVADTILLPQDTLSWQLTRADEIPGLPEELRARIIERFAESGGAEGAAAGGKGGSAGQSGGGGGGGDATRERLAAELAARRAPREEEGDLDAAGGAAGGAGGAEL